MRLARPWWIPGFLGRIPAGLEVHHIALVGIVSFAALFENYDMSMLSAALKQIRETFGLGQAEMSSMLAWVRIGAIPAFFILPLADRVGRRRVFLAAIVGMSVGTVLSAFAQTPLQFIAAQTLTRPFIVASIVTAVVIVAEELPAEHRGWGIGMLGAIGSFGFGLGALLYAFVDYIPFGWRSLYVVGGTPLLLFGFFRRTIPETRRFREHQEERGKEPEEEQGSRSIVGAAITPLVELFRLYPGRALAVTLMALAFATGSSPAFGLLSDFVQTEHGWQPSSYSLVILISGIAGAIGNPFMGWAADRLGRRPVAMAAFGLLPVTVFGIYYGPGWAIPFLSIPFLFLLTGGNVLMRVVASELFPTSTRNSAMGLETVNETIGAAIGYAVVGALALTVGGSSLGVGGSDSMGPAIFLVSLVTIAGVLVFWKLPETAGRELEETSQIASVDEAPR